MPRRRRHDHPGALHHVMHRGIARRTAFESQDDVRFFLSRLVREVWRGELAVEAFVIMQTHFHLLVRSLRGNLSDAMKRILFVYAMYFNRTRDRDGSLFRIRFLSKRVDSAAYRALLYSYFDDNPVHAGLVARPEEYRHGSAFWYARHRGPKWLLREWAEAEVMKMTGAETYVPVDYGRRFATKITPAIRQWVQRRLISRGEDLGEVDDLLAAPAPSVRAWMEERAAVADGTRPFLPILPAQTIDDLLAQARKDDEVWSCRIGTKRHDPYELLRPGLLRAACGLSQNEIAIRLCLHPSSIRRRLVSHRTAANNDERYAERAAELLKAALTEVFGEAASRP